MSCASYFMQHQYTVEAERLLKTVPSFCLVNTKGISLKAARRVCERAHQQGCAECAAEFVDREVH